mmetsp:Transcript_87248/g.251645  ORF Transcript_87248/g.251645 Transcript_87248/m.251645 type:complete len:218 (-) Transcript_87248:555-1208(-)
MQAPDEWVRKAQLRMREGLQADPKVLDPRRVTANTSLQPDAEPARRLVPRDVPDKNIHPSVPRQILHEVSLCPGHHGDMDAYVGSAAADVPLHEARGAVDAQPEGLVGDVGAGNREVELEEHDPIRLHRDGRSDLAAVDHGEVEDVGVVKRPCLERPNFLLPDLQQARVRVVRQHRHSVVAVLEDTSGGHIHPPRRVQVFERRTELKDGRLQDGQHR